MDTEAKKNRAASRPAGIHALVLKLHPHKIYDKLSKFYGNQRNNAINRLWAKQEYVLSQKKNFTEDFLQKNSHIGEIEHQVGRYLHMQHICNEIILKGYSGDIVEFGTWRGLGLIFFGDLFGKDSQKRKFIGIDSFEGLPISSGGWKQGTFNNTSMELARSNIEKYFQKTPIHFELIKGWFNDAKVKEQLTGLTNDIILVHFDADLGVSTSDALKLITPYLLKRHKPIYFLFDDWGCHPDEVPDAFYRWLESAQTTIKFKAKKLSSTRFTRYYRLDFES